MDAPQQERPSAIPRLSRLPVARSAASAIPKPAPSGPSAPAAVRRVPSVELRANGGWGLQQPKLRRVPSRPESRSSTASAPTFVAPPPPSPATRQSRPAPSLVKPKVLASPRRASSLAAPTPAEPLRQSSRERASQSRDQDGLGSLPTAQPTCSTPAKSRMSLSERTIGTLAQIPSSPAMSKRPSSFFDPAHAASRAGSGNSRPSSSYNSDGSAASSSGDGSGPGSSADCDGIAAGNRRASSAYFRPSFSAVNRSPSRPSDFGLAKTPKVLATPRRSSMAPTLKTPVSSAMARSSAKSPTPGKNLFAKSVIKSGAKTVADRPAVPKVPAKGLFRKPSLPANPPTADSTPSCRTQTGPKSEDDDALAPASARNGLEPPRALKSRKSSAALREQIAKAKAAKRSVAQQAPNGAANVSTADDTPDFEASIDDPFNVRRCEPAGSRVLKQRVARARTSGRLNIAALGLKKMPAEVLKMYQRVTLPALREINLFNNLLTSMEPLTQLLEAPALDKLDVSANRVRTIAPGLKQAFPQLTVLLASKNKLAELRPEDIKGLKTVDASDNEITQLNPRIGMLGGQGGLQRLEVTGNKFKVPQWKTLERGTEATLQWLRDRVPADEMAAWLEENGEMGGGDGDVD